MDEQAMEELEVDAAAIKDNSSGARYAAHSHQDSPARLSPSLLKSQLHT